MLTTPAPGRTPAAKGADDALSWRGTRGRSPSAGLRTGCATSSLGVTEWPLLLHCTPLPFLLGFRCRGLPEATQQAHSVAGSSVFRGISAPWWGAHTFTSTVASRSFPWNDSRLSVASPACGSNVPHATSQWRLQQQTQDLHKETQPPSQPTSFLHERERLLQLSLTGWWPNYKSATKTAHERKY